MAVRDLLGCQWETITYGLLPDDDWQLALEYLDVRAASQPRKQSSTGGQNVIASGVASKEERQKFREERAARAAGVDTSLP